MSDFFHNCKEELVWIDDIPYTIEEIYQAFRERLLEEIKLQPGCVHEWVGSRTDGSSDSYAKCIKCGKVRDTQA